MGVRAALGEQRGLRSSRGGPPGGRHAPPPRGRGQGPGRGRGRAGAGQPDVGLQGSPGFWEALSLHGTGWTRLPSRSSDPSPAPSPVEFSTRDPSTRDPAGLSRSPPPHPTPPPFLPEFGQGRTRPSVHPCPAGLGVRVWGKRADPLTGKNPGTELPVSAASGGPGDPTTRLHRPTAHDRHTDTRLASAPRVPRRPGRQSTLLQDQQGGGAEAKRSLLGRRGLR